MAGKKKAKMAHEKNKKEDNTKIIRVFYYEKNAKGNLKFKSRYERVPK